MDKPTRRGFLATTLPATAFLAPGLFQQPKPPTGNNLPLARNAAEYAARFLRDVGLQVGPDGVAGSHPVVSCIYGMATTVVSAAGRPVGVSFVHGEHANAGASHTPMLWTLPNAYDVTKSSKPDSEYKKQLVGWNLTGRSVEFSASEDVKPCRYIDSSEIVHGWQDPARVPFLNDVTSGAVAKPLNQIEAPEVSAAYLKLNQGVLESGVPWSEAGRLGLFEYGNWGKTKGTQISDNELWSFWLPAGATTLTVLVRPIGKPAEKPSTLITLKVSKPNGVISCFFAHDLLPAQSKSYRLNGMPNASDALNFWKATTLQKASAFPTFLRSVYGARFLSAALKANDGEPHCTRSRIRLS